MRLAEFLAAVVSVAVPVTASGQTAPSNYTWATRYDLMHRVTGMISPDPDGTGPLHFAAVRNTYDDAGRLVTVEKGELSNWRSEAVAPADWAGFFSVFSRVDTTYDALDRKVTEKTSSSGTPYELTQYNYDAVGRLQCTAVRMNPAAFGSLPDACALGTAGSNGPDRITKNVYDAAGQLIQVIKAYGTPDQQAYATYAYSPDGKQTDVIDANGNHAQMAYDGFDRLQTWTFPGKTAPTAYNPSTVANAFATAGAINSADYEQYGYDANGNRTSLRKRDGQTISYTYDALNRMTLKHEPVGSDVYYGYDLQGHQLYARFGSTTGPGITNTYDGLGRLATTSSNQSGTTLTVSHQYDADGNRTHVTHPDGTDFVYGYDGLDRLNSIEENGATVIASVAYDPTGTVHTLTRGAVTTTYGYDGVSRPTSIADDLAGTASDETSTLGYNPASQIVTRTSSNDAYAFTGYVNVTRNYTPNGLNQYTAAGPASFGYDPNGNLTSDGSSTYTYDPENRLLTATGAASATLVYDPLGRLYQTTGSGGTTRYLYDGDELVEEYNASGVVLRRFVHGNEEDDPLIWYEGGTVSSATRRSLEDDYQGSIVSVADSSGNLIHANSYDEYGIPAAGNLGRFQYTGQAWIPELGMYYYKARIYSPSLGRFMQTDPVGYKDQINLYAYVANDPVNRADPTGLYECSKSDCKKIAPLVSRLKYFTKHFSAHSASERAALSTAKSALSTLGTENDGNGLNVSGQSLNTNYNSSSLTLGEGSGSEIHLDFKAIDISARAMGDNNPEYLGAAVLGHEATHSFQDRSSGSFNNNLSIEYQREKQAYTTESYIDSFYGTPAFPYGGRSTFINRGAAGSCSQVFLNNVNSSPTPFTGDCK